MRKNFPLTIEQLLACCQAEVAKGNAKKYVLLSDDEEGNGYHECYFTFSEGKEVLDDNYMDYPSDLKPEDCVVLG